MLIVDEHTRDGFKEALSEVGPGDALLVYTARPLVRSTLKLTRLIVSVVNKGADFLSLAEPWLNTSLPGADLIDGVLRFERDLLRERTTVGRARAAKNGVRFGRPPKLSEVQRAAALDMYVSGVPQIDIAGAFNLCPATISTLVRDHTSEVW